MARDARLDFSVRFAVDFAEGKAQEGVPLPMPSASGGALIDVFSYFVYSASY